MTAAPSRTALTPSCRATPCPICGRSKDGDCRISPEQVLCHHGSSHHPPEGLKPGEVITGRDGQQWAYCKDSADGLWATFVLDRPRSESAPTSEPPTRGAESVWRYSDTFLVCRFPGKRIRPLTWVDGAWVWKAPGGKRPLLLSHQLADRPDAQVLVVEGEKTWDAAQRLFPQVICCTWSGGCKALQKSDFTPLAGRSVVLWPDNDEPGRRAIEQLAETLHRAGVTAVRIVANPPDATPGWDLADAIWTPAEAATWAKGHTTAWAPPAAAPLRLVEGHEHQQGARRSSRDRRKLEPDEVLALLPERLGQLRLNVRSGDVHTRDGVLNGNAISRLYLQLSNSDERWGKEVTADAVALLASQNPFDPVQDYLKSIKAEALPMKQWERLDQHLLGIDDPIAAAFLPRYLISAVARAFEPGCDVRQVPVLIGPQWRGKSALGRILFGSEHWVEGVEDLGKDALMKARSAWGVELAELDGVTRRSDQERLKAFITETVDTYRAPYDRSPERHARRFVFWATSNGAPLRDSTGSTRFVCIKVPDRMLPLGWAAQHRDAIWARAVEQFLAGVEWRHGDEAERQAIEARNADHAELDPWADRVASYLSKAERLQQLPVKVAEVLTHLEVPVERQTNAAAKRVTGIAQQLGWEHARRRQGGTKQQGLWPVHGHPGHPGGHPVGTPEDSSAARGSDPVGTPDTPKSEKFKKSAGGRGHHKPAAEEACSTEGFDAFGVSGVPTAENDCTAADLPLYAGVPTGVPSEVHGTIQPGDSVELLSEIGTWSNGWRLACIEETSIGPRARIEAITGSAYRIVPPDQLRPCKATTN